MVTIGTFHEMGSQNLPESDTPWPPRHSKEFKVYSKFSSKAVKVSPIRVKRSDLNFKITLTDR